MSHATPARSLGRYAAYGAVAAACLAADPKPAGFAFPYKDKETGRLLVRFSGDSSETMPGSFDLVRVHGFKVETFGREETPELVGSGPECLLNLKTREANSSGPLTVTQVAGQFEIRGVGFSWNQQEGHLVLSNRVESTFPLAVVHPAHP